MIRYALRCNHAHAFEAWFQNSDAFDEQSAEGHVSCPECGSTQVEKALMAPGIPAKQSDVGGIGPREFFNQMRAYRSKVLAETEDVGSAFPKEARQMHEGEIEHRAIRGNATEEEVRKLKEDGIPIAPVPPEPPSEN